jgi:transcriptional regulator with XRE-family HTH domain
MGRFGWSQRFDLASETQNARTTLAGHSQDQEASDLRVRRGCERRERGERLENVTSLRRKRDLTRERLSKRLSEMGRPIAMTGLARLEAGRRRVDADDMVGLALALGVSPVRLLLPGRDENDEHPADVALTDTVTLPWESAWKWGVGEMPLHGSHAQFLRASRPFDPQRHELSPGIRARMETLETQVKTLLAVLEAVAPGGLSALVNPDGTLEVTRGQRPETS